MTNITFQSFTVYLYYVYGFCPSILKEAFMNDVMQILRISDLPTSPLCYAKMAVLLTTQFILSQKSEPPLRALPLVAWRHLWKFPNLKKILACFYDKNKNIVQSIYLLVMNTIQSYLIWNKQIHAKNTIIDKLNFLTGNSK